MVKDEKRLSVEITNLDEVQDSQLAFCAIHDEHEIKRRITAVNDSPPFIFLSFRSEEGLKLWGVQKVTQRGWSGTYEREYLRNERLRRLMKRCVELG
jgi:hypothetical protein